MALKHLADQDKPAPTAGGVPWGRLAEKGETAQAVRFAVGDRTVSFPFHCLKRWEFIPGSPDALIIQADDETITVNGRLLGPIRDALDAGTLLVLRTRVGRFSGAAVPDETAVTGITFTVESR
jgi:hypothetical protein